MEGIEGEADRCVGGGDNPVNGMLSDTADVAKLSSSSTSSTISSGMAMTGRSVSSGSSTKMVSSDRNLRSDSGEISLDLLPSDDLTLLSSSHGARSVSVSRDEQLGFRLNSLRGENDQPEPGERDLADRLCCRSNCGAVPMRRKVSGGVGAGRGVVNLSAGLIVL